MNTRLKAWSCWKDEFRGKAIKQVHAITKYSILQTLGFIPASNSTLLKSVLRLWFVKPGPRLSSNFPCKTRLARMFELSRLVCSTLDAFVHFVVSMSRYRKGTCRISLPRFTGIFCKMYFHYPLCFWHVYMFCVFVNVQILMSGCQW